MPTQLNIFDISIVLGTLAFLTSIGLYAVTQDMSHASYFYGSKNARWMVMGVCLFSVEIFSIFFWGIAVNHTLIGVLLLILLFRGLLVPVFQKHKAYSLYSLFEKWYGTFASTFIAVYSIIISFLLRILLPLFMGSLFLEIIFGFNYLVTGLVLILLAGAYSIAGGLFSIIKVEKWQMIFIYLSVIVTTILTTSRLSGVNYINTLMLENLNAIVEYTHEFGDSFLSILVGAFLIGVGSFSLEPYFLQRVDLGDKKEMNRGILFSGFLTGIFLIIYLSPTMLLHFEQTQNLFTDSLLFYASSVHTNHAVGLFGFVIITFCIVLLSVLASAFNSISYTLTNNFYFKSKPHSTEKQLVLVGRLFTTVIAILTIFCIPFIPLVKLNLLKYLVVIYTCLTPPVLAIFLLGLLENRVNHKGAKYALIFGIILGFLRILLEMASEVGLLSEGILSSLINVNIFYFGFGLLILTTAAHFLTSITIISYSNIIKNKKILPISSK